MHNNHLMLVDVKNTCNITGKEAEEILDKIHITVNKNFCRSASVCQSCDQKRYPMPAVTRPADMIPSWKFP